MSSRFARFVVPAVLALAGAATGRAQTAPPPPPPAPPTAPAAPLAPLAPPPDGRIVQDIRIDVPKPRAPAVRYDAAFNRHCAQVRAAMDTVTV